VAATLHPLPRLVSADEIPDPSLDPTRQRLAETIAALDRARAEVELAAEPVRRLSDVVSEYDRLEAQVRELDDRNASAMGAWIAAGCLGPAPDDSDAKSATARLVALRPALAAARHTLPAKEKLHTAAVARLSAAAADRNIALDELAVLVAAGVADELTQSLNEALKVEARLLSLHNALLERARDGTNSSAGYAAERIAAIIRAAKRSAGVQHNAESGRRLLAALATDPGAKLT
jgi:hypothetical protein